MFVKHAGVGHRAQHPLREGEGRGGMLKVG